MDKSIDEIKQIIKEGFSVYDVCIKIYGYCNGKITNKFNAFIVQHGIDTSHFAQRNKNTKHQKVERECPVCETKFIVLENEDKVTCSFSCANRHFRKVRPLETREKISSTLVDGYKEGRIKSLNKGKSKEYVCVSCGTVFERRRKSDGKLSSSKCCSRACSVNMIKSRALKRVEDGLHQGWTTRNIASYPELFFKKVLEQNGIPFEFNKRIKKKDLGINCKSNYFLDFYLPLANIDLEIDGKQHEYEDRVVSDNIRDEHLSKICTVYRIKWRKISTDEGKKYIKSEIVKFLAFYSSCVDKMTKK